MPKLLFLIVFHQCCQDTVSRELKSIVSALKGSSNRGILDNFAFDCCCFLYGAAAVTTPTLLLQAQAVADLEKIFACGPFFVNRQLCPKAQWHSPSKGF